MRLRFSAPVFVLDLSPSACRLRCGPGTLAAWDDAGHQAPRTQSPTGWERPSACLPRLDWPGTFFWAGAQLGVLSNFSAPRPALACLPGRLNGLAASRAPLPPPHHLGQRRDDRIDSKAVGAQLTSPCGPSRRHSSKRRAGISRLDGTHRCRTGGADLHACLDEALWLAKRGVGVFPIPARLGTKFHATNQSGWNCRSLGTHLGVRLSGLDPVVGLSRRWRWGQLGAAGARARTHRRYRRCCVACWPVHVAQRIARPAEGGQHRRKLPRVLPSQFARHVRGCGGRAHAPKPTSPRPGAQPDAATSVSRRAVADSQPAARVGMRSPGRPNFHL